MSSKDYSNGDFDTLDNNFIELWRKNGKISEDSPEYATCKKIATIMFQKSLKDTDFKNKLVNNFERIHYNLSKLNWNLSKESKDPKGQVKLKIALVGYHEQCGPWDFSTKIPGGFSMSQNSLIDVSKELSSRGHSVCIFCNPPERSLWSLPSASPRFFNCKDFLLETTRYDIAILWQKNDFSGAAQRADRVIWWPQTFTPKLTLPPMDSLDQCIFSSESQRTSYLTDNPSLSSKKYIIACIDKNVSSEQCDVSWANPYSCAFTSKYDQGLVDILKMWPKLRKEYPRTILNIYHEKNDCPKDTLKEVNSLIETVGKKGIIEHGFTPKENLSKCLSKNSLWLCPEPSKDSSFSDVLKIAHGKLCLPVIHLADCKKLDIPELSVFKNDPEQCVSFEDTLSRKLLRLKESDDNLRDLRLKYQNSVKLFSVERFVDGILDVSSK